ncbi:hypothetical protein SLS53_004884 [Cytospora paraplurivora]|uniref:Uncharacterized protein n=1 Tax=Cytospora paraplurivora TaxID=2898453 RepID=A0AAN9YFW1_9PEZI
MSSEQHRHHHHTLRALVPRAGFLWEDPRSVLGKCRKDRTVLDALRSASGYTPREVQQILADLFDMAEADAQAGKIDQYSYEEEDEDKKSKLYWVSTLRDRLRWAQHLEDDLFVLLFLRLYDARRAWHENPREPFNTNAKPILNLKTEEHGVLARAIDRFHAAASDGWVGCDDELFQWAQPPRVEGEEEEEERTGDDPVAAAPHTQGMGALAAAGEPHPQTPLELGGAEEEEENGRVREVRKRLARTSLVEEMEVDE